MPSTMIRHARTATLAWLLALTATWLLAAEQPAALFLTWQRDPATTITIDWHTTPADGSRAPDSVVRFKPLGSDTWTQADAARHPFPFSARTIHRVELSGLAPDTVYQFRVGPFERVYRFRTMPARLEQPLVFAVGGDVRHRAEWMEQMNRVVMRHKPRFIVWGGDLAYADGLESRVANWEEWFDAIHNTLICDEGQVVPIVVGIGNHEVLRGYYSKHDDYEQTDAGRRRIAPYFFDLLAFPGQPGYNVLDFGDYLSLVVLDSGHANPIAGRQAEWLKQTLAQRRGRAHVIPIYHVPAYPSHRGYTDRTSADVRQHWVPLFERHGVQIAFENHDHTYKRTEPIRQGQVDPSGVVYLGDGAWGVQTRKAHDADKTWYLAKSIGMTRHAIVVTLHPGSRHFRAVSAEGATIDQYRQEAAR